MSSIETTCVYECSSRHKCTALVSVGFFDDMHVPITYLPTPSTLYAQSLLSLSKPILFTHAYLSDPNERAHFWFASYEPPADNPEHLPTKHELLDSPIAQRMYIDAGETVRVRVELDEFYDDEPGPPKAGEGGVMPKDGRMDKRRAPYTITVRLTHYSTLHAQSAQQTPFGGLFFRVWQCSMAEQGLGPLPWWRSPPEDLEDGEDGEGDADAEGEREELEESMDQ